MDRELAPAELDEVQQHLGECSACRERASALAAASIGFERVYLDGPGIEAATAASFARARLRARLAEQDAPPKRAEWIPFSVQSWAAACLAVLVTLIGIGFASGWMHPRNSHEALAAFEPLVPDAKLTPGAVRPLDISELCGAGGPAEDRPPASLQRAVFHEYGMDGAAPDGYEVDHLITPALGGSDDIRNLWPESYSSEWNAHVKDDLEDYLHRQVCTGKMDLPTAQREIATNWITAYRKYFRTDRPLRRNSGLTSRENQDFGG